APPGGRLSNECGAATSRRTCMFATVFLGVRETSRGALAYVNAGHDARVLIGPAGARGRLPVTGPVVGISPNITYGLSRASLAAGETLLVYTDGVTEARGPGGQFFTERRLLSLL